jgi:hypothetical protein
LAVIKAGTFHSQHTQIPISVFMIPHRWIQLEADSKKMVTGCWEAEKTWALLDLSVYHFRRNCRPLLPQLIGNEHQF